MNYENISVDEALKRGRKSVNIPAIAILAGGMLGIPFVIMAFENKALAAGICLPIPFLAAFLYWSFSVTKWRLWAFQNVRNVHELEKRAIKEKIIGKRGSFFEKAEIRSFEQREKWQELQTKFEREDVFIDEKDVPAETKIFYSKNVKRAEAVIGFLLLVPVGIFILSFQPQPYLGIAMIGMGLFICIRSIIDLRSKEPLLVINESGLKTKKDDFVGWDSISGEDVILKQRGKSAVRYFIYYIGQTKKEIQVSAIGIKSHELERLLRVYRGRFEQKKKTTDPNTYRF